MPHLPSSWSLQSSNQTQRRGHDAANAAGCGRSATGELGQRLGGRGLGNLHADLDGGGGGGSAASGDGDLVGRSGTGDGDGVGGGGNRGVRGDWGIGSSSSQASADRLSGARDGHHVRGVGARARDAGGQDVVVDGGGVRALAGEVGEVATLRAGGGGQASLTAGGDGFGLSTGGDELV